MLKKWGIYKNIPASDMKILIAKSERRKREGKDTDFYFHDRLVDAQKFRRFVKRKVSQEGDMPSPSAGMLRPSSERKA